MYKCVQHKTRKHVHTIKLPAFIFSYFLHSPSLLTISLALLCLHVLHHCQQFLLASAFALPPTTKWLFPCTYDKKNYFQYNIDLLPYLVLSLVFLFIFHYINVNIVTDASSCSFPALLVQCCTSMTDLHSFM